jgi:hypothetical protein
MWAESFRAPCPVRARRPAVRDATASRVDGCGRRARTGRRRPPTPTAEGRPRSSLRPRRRQGDAGGRRARTALTMGRREDEREATAAARVVAAMDALVRALTPLSHVERARAVEAISLAFALPRVVDAETADEQDDGFEEEPT